MWQRWPQYILLPSIVFLIALAIGAATSWGMTSYDLSLPHAKDRITDWANPFPIMIWVYWGWNIYHFGMQHFGIARLSGIRSRYPMMVLCLITTVFLMAALPILIGGSSRFFWIIGIVLQHQWTIDLGLAPFIVSLAVVVTSINRWIAHNELGFPIFLLMIGVISVNHWVVDIGLSGRVATRGWLFAGAVLVAGAVGFAWMIPTERGMMIAVIPIMLGARYGLGFVHFLYSRWVWRLGSPIGAALVKAN
jgi:hypothetical protein